ncbi:MAG: hypothetical protein QOI13_1692 [Paraburkholderia sp.]|nr:hypothetical protein [Paraburkholderia sp.]
MMIGVQFTLWRAFFGLRAADTRNDKGRRIAPCQSISLDQLPLTSLSDRLKAFRSFVAKSRFRPISLDAFILPSYT